MKVKLVKIDNVAFFSQHPRAALIGVVIFHLIPFY